MITDEVLQRALVARILAANLPDTPDRPAHHIGPLTLPDGRTCALFVRHAVDALLSDAAGNIVLITRRHPPGAGLLATPGGFMDVIGGTIEDAATTARRELAEETGIDAAIIQQAVLTGIGWRRYDRPFDLRVAWNDLPDTDIKKDDVFLVSTQPVYLRTAADLTAAKLAAADDATAACVMAMASLRAESLGVADQFVMVGETPVI